jgi:hypothetical protein
MTHTTPIKAHITAKCPVMDCILSIEAAELMVEHFPESGLQGKETWIGFRCPECGETHLIKD